MKMKIKLKYLLYSASVLLFLSFAGCDNGGVSLPPPLTDQEAVNKDVETLEIEYAEGDSAEQVTADLTLPLTGERGTQISWVSENEYLIDNEGQVFRPSISKTVQLTATISKGDISGTKTFLLMVLAEEITDQMAVEKESELINIVFSSDDTAESVKYNIELPVSSVYGCDILWNSSHENIISTQGQVNRQNEDVIVSLNAVISKGEFSISRSFTLTVLAVNEEVLTEEQEVNAAADALEIIFAPGDSADSVTSNVILPDQGLYDTSIIWISFYEDVMSNEGQVIRQNEEFQVTLKAIISKGNYSTFRIFTALVLPENYGILTEEEEVNAAYDALEIIFAAGDSADSVTSNLVFPSEGLYETSITWTSTDLDCISKEGIVTPQEEDTTLEVWATLTKGDSTKYKRFFITVPKKVLTDQEKVDEDWENLSPIFTAGDTLNHVTGNLTLPSLGNRGTEITWTSSNVEILEENGTVHRPEVDNAQINLTAKLSLNDISRIKEFTLNIREILDYGELYFTFTKSNRITGLTAAGKAMKELNIPETIDGFPMTIIDDEVFKDNKVLEKVYIPNTISELGEYVFYGCSNLIQVEFEENSSLTCIPMRTFQNCVSLESIVLPEGISLLEQAAFRDCASLNSVVIPESMTTLDKYAFYGCNSLKNIDLKNVTSLGDCAFYQSGLTKITMPHITSIGTAAFRYCDFNYFPFPESYKPEVLPSEMFRDCDRLIGITIPDSIKEINSYAFTNCPWLVSVNLPPNLEKIGHFAFAYTNLSSMTLPETLNSIGLGAFAGPNDTPGISYGLSESPLEWIKFEGSVPPVVESSSYYSSVSVFKDCGNLTQIMIPSGSMAAYSSSDLAEDYTDILIEY